MKNNKGQRGSQSLGNKIKGIFIKQDPSEQVPEVVETTIETNEVVSNDSVGIADIVKNKVNLKNLAPKTQVEDEADESEQKLINPVAFNAVELEIASSTAFLEHSLMMQYPPSSIEYALFLKLLSFEKQKGKVVDTDLINETALKLGLHTEEESDDVDQRAVFETKFKAGYINTSINTYIASQLARLSNKDFYYSKFKHYSVDSEYDLKVNNGYFAATNAYLLETIPADVVDVAIAEANEIVDLAIKRNLSAETPADLMEEYRSLTFASNGKPVGKLIAKKDITATFASSDEVNNAMELLQKYHNSILEDFDKPSKFSAAWLWWGYWAVAGYLAIDAGTMTGYRGSTSFSVGFFALALTAAIPLFFTLRFFVGMWRDLKEGGNIISALGYAFMYSVFLAKTHNRRREHPVVPQGFSDLIVDAASEVHTKISRVNDLKGRDIGDVIIDNAGKHYPLTLEQAREEQVENAIKDKTKFLKLGTSTGFMSNRMDPFAPTKAGMDFGFSLNDASTHILILGGSGSGKTTGVIRPIAKSILASANEDFGRKNGIGAIVLDGKGPLPLELKDLADDYHVINPQYSVFNPIENLSASEVADGFYDMYAAGSVGKDDYWNQAAAKLIRTSGVMLSLSSKEWTLHNLYKAVTDDSWAEELFEEIKTNIIEHGAVLNSYEENAISYRMHEFMNLALATKQSYLGNATVWLSSVVDNEKLSAWGAAANGLMVEDVVTGKKFGFALPESDFGQAGQLISIFAKKRAYKAIKSRGDVWKDDPEQTAVMLIADEVQNLLTEDESAMLPIARSLGLYCVFSTQNIDGIVAAYGGSEIKANQLLGNMASMVALRSETKLTRSFISERMGSEWRTSYSKVADGNGFQKVKNQDSQTFGGSVLDAKLNQVNAELGQLVASQTYADVKERKDNRVQDKYDSERLNQNAEVQEEKWAAQNMYDEADSRYLAQLARRIKQLEFKRDQLAKAKELEENIDVGIHRLVSEEEISSILSVPNTALAQVVRGRVMRRDKIKLNPIYSIN